MLRPILKKRGKIHNIFMSIYFLHVVASQEATVKDAIAHDI